MMTFHVQEPATPGCDHAYFDNNGVLTCRLCGDVQQTLVLKAWHSSAWDRPDRANLSHGAIGDGPYHKLRPIFTNRFRFVIVDGGVQDAAIHVINIVKALDLPIDVLHYVTTIISQLQRPISSIPGITYPHLVAALLLREMRVRDLPCTLDGLNKVFKASGWINPITPRVISKASRFLGIKIPPPRWEQFFEQVASQIQHEFKFSTERWASIRSFALDDLRATPLGKIKGDPRISIMYALYIAAKGFAPEREHGVSIERVTRACGFGSTSIRDRNKIARPRSGLLFGLVMDIVNAFQIEDPLVIKDISIMTRRLETHITKRYQKRLFAPAIFYIIASKRGYGLTQHEIADVTGFRQFYISAYVAKALELLGGAP